MSIHRDANGNLLLALLDSDILERAGLEEQDHAIRDVLARGEDPHPWLYFPHPGAACSIVRTTAVGQMVETGVVGNEGLLNVHTFLSGPAPTWSDAIVQSEGRFSRIDARAIRSLFESEPQFRDALLAYVSLFLDQVSQNLVCNRLHPIEQRLAKWLLVMHDRVGRTEMQLTQEFLSYMLGVHRPGVSLAVGALEAEGVIRHRRNRIELTSVDRVLERSCECYLPLRQKLLGFVARHRSTVEPA